MSSNYCLLSRQSGQTGTHIYAHTHTHTHTHIERERDQRDRTTESNIIVVE